jgi:hypothetical protein
LLSALPFVVERTLLGFDSAQVRRAYGSNPLRRIRSVSLTLHRFDVALELRLEGHQKRRFLFALRRFELCD